MSFEEEFDKIIRQKAEDAKYPFDEGGWHKVSTLLDGERKAVAGAGFKKAIIPIAALLTIGAVGFFAYTFIGVDETPVLPKTELISQISEPVSVTSVVQPEEKTSLTAELQKAAAESKVVKAESNVNRPIPKSADGSIIEKVSKEDRATTVKQNKPAEEDSESVDQTIAQDEEKSQEASVKSIEPGKEIASNERELKPEPIVQDIVVPVNQPENNDNMSAENVGRSDVQAVASYNKVVADELFPVSALMPLNQTEQDLKEGYPYPLVKDDDYYNQGKLAKKHYLNIEAGGVYLFGWDQAKSKDGKGFDYFGGLNYGRYINRKFSISLGLQVYNVSNIAKPFYEVTNKEYGFGSTSMYTVVTTNNMLFAAVPVKFNYALNNRNTIALGMNFGYLVAANSYVETYYMRDNEKIYSGTSRSNQIFEGTRSLNMMLTAGYTLHLSNRIAIKGEYLLGLTDLFKNTRTITSSEKTSGIRVGIQYTLFDK